MSGTSLRGLRRRRGTTLLSTAAAAALAAVVAWAGAAPGASAATARAGSGLAQASSPGPDSSAAPHSALQSAWQSVLAERGIRHALIGAYAYDVTTGKTLASINANWRLTPGSVTKLYATAASLADWGDRFGLVTRIAQASAGGPVYLTGGGDLFGAPFAQPVGNAELERIAKVVAARVHHRATRVVGVSTLFSGWTAGPAWDVSEVGAMGDPFVSALTSDRDDLELTAAAGASVGSKPVVTFEPGNPSMVPPGFFRVENDAVTGPAGSPNTLYIRCLPGTDTIVLSGSKPLGSHPAGGYLAIGNPSLFTAALFQYYLTRDGVSLAQPATTGTLPASARELYTYRSPQSLRTYIRIQNSWSVNQMAENLYRLLGVARHGTGSPQDAKEAITAYLARARLPQDRVQVDGSGLSVLDEMSAAQLGQLLSYVAHQRYFVSFEHSLIHIGPTNQCTFMCGYMDHTAAAWHVWLKTGNLANQWNYAGYAHAKNGNLIAFALLFDGLQEDNAFNQAIGPIDKMTVDAARWPDEPDAPAPAPASAPAQAPASVPASAPASAPASVPASDSGAGGVPARVAAMLPASADQAAQSSYAPGDVVSSSVVNVTTGKVVAQSNGQTELQGGLLGRLATVATALQHAPQLKLQGPEIQATGPVSDGRVDGDLILNGRYDPMFGRPQLTYLARSMARKGIRSVAGRLEFVAGGSQPFGNQADGVSNLPFSTPHEDVGASFSPPDSPLVVGQDQVTIAVRGAAEPGEPAQVTVEPAGSPVRVTGTVRTVASAPASARPASARPAAVWQPGSQAYRLSGSVTPGERAALPVAPPYPALVAADWLLAALRSAGITVHGPPVEIASDPGGSRLASQPAPSLAAEVNQALTEPSNTAPFDMYQQLGRNAAADVAALVGSFDQIIDPSGNAADNFLTADSISKMLAAVHPDPAEAPLVSQLQQPWIVRLPERTTLTGFTTGAGGQLLAYTIIINGQLYNPTPDLPSRFEPLISH